MTINVTLSSAASVVITCDDSSPASTMVIGQSVFIPPATKSVAVWYRASDPSGLAAARAAPGPTAATQPGTEAASVPS